MLRGLLRDDPRGDDVLSRFERAARGRVRVLRTRVHLPRIRPTRLRRGIDVYRYGSQRDVARLRLVQLHPGIVHVSVSLVIHEHVRVSVHEQRDRAGVPSVPADVRRGRTRRRRGNVRRVPSRVGQRPRRRPFLGDRNLLRIEMQRDVILVERERGRRRRCERRVRDVELGFERRERRRRRREWRGRRRRRIRSRVSSARRRVRSNGRRHRGHARRRSLWIRSRDRRAREAAGDRGDERDVDRRGGSRVRVERRRGGLGAPRVGHRHRRGGTVQGSGESVQRRRAHRVRNPGVVGGVKPRRRARVRVDQGCDRAGLETRRGYRSVLARERRRGGVIRKRHALGHRREARRRARHRFRFGHRVQPNRRSVRAATLSTAPRLSRGVRRLGTQRIFRRDVARRRRRGVRVAVQGRQLHRGRRERRHRQGVPIDGRHVGPLRARRRRARRRRDVRALGRPLVGVVDPARRGHRRRRRG